MKPLPSQSIPEERQGRFRQRAVIRGIGRIVLWGLLGVLFLTLASLGWVHGSDKLLTEIAGGCFVLVAALEVVQLRWRLLTTQAATPWQEYWKQVRAELRGAYPWLRDEEAAPISVKSSQRAEQDWSTVHLKGFGKGRFWEVAFLPSGVGGDYGATFHASFRGAPPKHEAERTLPYFFLVPYIPGWTPTGRKAQAFVLDRLLKGKSTVPVDIGPRGPRLLRGASYPPADRELASVAWTEAYLGWCRPGTPHHRWNRNWPTLVGIVPNLDLNFVLKPSTPPSEWAALFGRFVEETDWIERIFEAPPPSLVPLEFATLPRSDSREPPGVSPLYTCTRCGKLSKVKPVGLLGKPLGTRANLATLCCETRLFREMLPPA